jgi:hypothetical protein
VSSITASHAGALVRFSDLFPCHGRSDDVDPVGLDRPLALASLLVVGCRAGLDLVFAIPAGLGFRSRCRFSARLPTLSSSAVHRAFIGPDRLNRRALYGTRQIDPHALPLLRFVSLQRLQVVLRHPRGGQPADHPASTFTSASRPAGGRCHGEADLRPCGFIALCASCARPTPRDELHDSHRPGAGDCATVSLSRGVPLPA